MSAALVYTSDHEHDAARAQARDEVAARRRAAYDAHAEECDCWLEDEWCEGIDPAPLPDPVSLDATRPFDLDLCSHCMGDGAYQVQTGDPYPGAWDAVECSWCAGTGQRGAA